LRARGDGDLRGENKGLETGLARLAIETGRRICSGRLDAASCVSTQTMIDLKESQMGTTFAVRIHPRAKKNAITGRVGDVFKLAITAPPVNGKANEACIEFFAKLLNVPRSSVTIAAGQTSRKKVIRVSGLTAQQVRDRLGD
jgi:uncharacterized protein (TIGR00251 family)